MIFNSNLNQANNLLITVSFFLLFVGCQSSHQTATPSIALICTPFTQITVNRTDGTVYQNSTLDSTLTGKKVILVSLNANKNITETNLVIAWWKAGDRAHNRNVQHNVNLPVPANSQHSVNVELPGTELLNQCDGFYFMVSVNYIEQDGTPAVYVEQPRGFLLSKNYLADGSIQTINCSNTLPSPDL